MKITLIAALGKNRVIGVNNQLPWHLPADLKHFKTLTLHKPILMGRKTFQSIGKPLPKRDNMILTRDETFQAQGCHVVHTFDEALAVAEGLGVEELMVIGGANLYEQLLPRADKLELTLVEAELEGDAFFPAWDHREWREVKREDHGPDEKNDYGYRFITLIRTFPSPHPMG